MLNEVRDQLRVTPNGLRGDVGKYEGETPFGIWLATRVLSDQSWSDETSGTVEWRHWFARAGRFGVVEDDRGFVSVTRFADVAHARAWFDAEDEDYAEWNAQGEDADEVETESYAWSRRSALWQVEHGEADTARTESARAFVASGRTTFADEVADAEVWGGTE